MTCSAGTFWEWGLGTRATEVPGISDALAPGLAESFGKSSRVLGEVF